MWAKSEKCNVISDLFSLAIIFTSHQKLLFSKSSTLSLLSPLLFGDEKRFPLKRLLSQTNKHQIEKIAPVKRLIANIEYFPHEVILKDLIRLYSCWHTLSLDSTVSSDALFDKQAFVWFGLSAFPTMRERAVQEWNYCSLLRQCWSLAGIWNGKK